MFPLLMTTSSPTYDEEKGREGKEEQVVTPNCFGRAAADGSSGKEKEGRSGKKI